MPIDPRLNCAAEICCSPPDALRMRVELLTEAGVPEDLAPKIAAKLADMGIALLPAELAAVIYQITYGSDAAAAAGMETEPLG